MITGTDIIFTIFIMFFVAQGWEKGFVRCIVGPISLGVSLLVSHLVFRQSGNIAIAAAIALLGPTILTFVLGQLFASAKRIHSEPLGPNSRILGAVFSSFWGGSLLMIIIVVIALIPFPIPYLDKAQADIHRSYSYRLMQPVMKKVGLSEFMPSKEGKGTVANLKINDPAVAQKIHDSQEYQEILEDENIQAIITDPAVIQAVENGNFSELFSNPDIMKLTQDPEMIKKMMKLYGTLMNEGTAAALPDKMP